MTTSRGGLATVAAGWVLALLYLLLADSLSPTTFYALMSALVAAGAGGLALVAYQRGVSRAALLVSLLLGAVVSFVVLYSLVILFRVVLLGDG